MKQSMSMLAGMGPWQVGLRRCTEKDRKQYVLCGDEIAESREK